MTAAEIYSTLVTIGVFGLGFWIGWKAGYAEAKKHARLDQTISEIFKDDNLHIVDEKEYNKKKTPPERG